MAAFAPPSEGPRDFFNAFLTDRRLGPRLSEPGQRNPLPEIEVGATAPKAPVDYRPYATFGSTVGAIPETVAGRYEMKWIGAQELVASHDARTKYLQAEWLPEIYRNVEEFNRNTPDERDHINYNEDPMAIEQARRAGMRPDQFITPLYDILKMERDGTLENFKEENRALIAEQDERLRQLATERQDVAAELQRVRPRFRGEFGGNALFFDAANSFIADMVPALAAGMIGGPEAGLATMGGLVVPEEFASLKNEGKSDAEALFGSLARAAAEIAPEGGVMEIALKTATGKQMMRQLMGQLGEGKAGHVVGTGLAEMGSEELTELISVGIDKGWLDPDMTWSEAFTRLARAPLIGGGMGVAMGAVTAPLPEPNLPMSAFDEEGNFDETAFDAALSRDPDRLPEARAPRPFNVDPAAPDQFTPGTTADLADILTGQGGEGFAAPFIPQKSDIPMELPINITGGPTISSFDIVPPPATTGSPVPGIGGSVGPTAPSTASQGTAPERQPGAYVIEVQVDDETSQGGSAIVEATPGVHGGWTLIQPNGNTITVPVEDNRPLAEIVTEYTSASKDPNRVRVRKDQEPLAAAFQKSAPPATPASTEPAPTTAPQAGPTVSPTQEPPAGGAASQPTEPTEPPTLGEVVTPKPAPRRARKPPEPPRPAQGKLFGSEGEVVAPVPPPPVRRRPHQLRQQSPPRLRPPPRSQPARSPTSGVLSPHSSMRRRSSASTRAKKKTTRKPSRQRVNCCRSSTNWNSCWPRCQKKSSRRNTLPTSAKTSPQSHRR